MMNITWMSLALFLLISNDEQYKKINMNFRFVCSFTCDRNGTAQNGFRSLGPAKPGLEWIYVSIKKSSWDGMD